MCLENVCTSWSPEGCIEQKFWVSLIWIFLIVQANVQDLLGGTRTCEIRHFNATWTWHFLCYCTLCACHLGPPNAARLDCSCLPCALGNSSSFPLWVTLGKEVTLSFLGRPLHKQPQPRCCANWPSFHLHFEMVRTKVLSFWLLPGSCSNVSPFFVRVK